MKAQNLLWIPLFGLVIAGAWARNGGEYDLSWSTVDGGAGRGQGGDIAVSGSAGQPDAGRSEKGVFRVTGGFWALLVSTSATPIPTLTCTSTPTGTPSFPGTPTATPTATSHVPTGIPTPTPTPIPGDVNGDCKINSSDLFYFGLDWQESAAVANPRCNAVTDTIVDEQDLLLLLDQWSR